MVRMTIDAERADTFRVDDRGRVYLGRKYAGGEVELAIINAIEKRDEDEDDG